jgi:acyl-CoA synthetase (NDP forming)
MESSVILREQNTSAQRARLNRLLRPRSIALIGASSTAGSLADCVLTNLEDSKYSGDIHLVNPKRPVIHGRQCLGSISELPDGVDCAILAIPAASIVDAVRECAQKHVGSAIIFSAGFAESGQSGAADQAKLARIAHEYGMVVEGPNCLGMVNYLDGIPLTFVMTPPQEKRDIPGAAILSQSGALAAVIAVNMLHHHIPLTFSISTGNEAANSIEDFLEHLLGDNRIRVLALVVEQFRDPGRFLKLAHRAHLAGQYIVLLHPGRSAAARKSAATHTGAMAGDHEVMYTLVTRGGVIHVEHMEELVDVTQILVRCRELPAGGVAVFTESGAFKALTLDICDGLRLPLPALSSATERALRHALPAFIPPSNPLDLTAQGLVDPDLYRRTLPPVLADESFGCVLLAIILTDALTTRLKLTPIVDALSALGPRKPILFAALDEGAPFDFPQLEQLRSLGVPCFPSPERSLRAIARVSGRRTPLPFADLEPHPTPPFAIPRSGILSEIESKTILGQIGIAFPPGALAGTPEDALRIANQVGYPVVLKAHSAALSHKSDAGGVLLGIESDSELRQAWHALHRNVHVSSPGLHLEGVLVEREMERGLELIIGGRRDPQWGPILLVGLGGVLAEAVADTLLLPPDLAPDEIERELERLRCSAVLRGFRGGPALDTPAVARIVALLGACMRSEARICEIDINPLVVYARGKGAVALDALIAIDN